MIGGKALAVAIKELRQIRRDRRTLLILLFVPAFFLLVYGYALNFDIRNVRLAVLDQDRGTHSREVISAFVNSGYFDLTADLTATAAIDRVLDRDEARAVLVIPRGFGAAAAVGQPTALQVIVNGDNANTATTVVGYARALITTISAQYELRAYGRLQAAGRWQEGGGGDGGSRGGGAGSMLAIEPRVWYNPELRSTLFLVPGLIAYIATLTALVSTALSIVREKERGTMEQVRMAPLSPVAYVVGKSVPYFFISFASAIGIVAVSMVLFDLPMRGSWLALLGAISLFLIGALAFGLLISTIADTQQVAFQVALLVSFLPTLMLSGFIFPISSMPAPLQAITHIVPARYFLVVLRGILLKGVGLDILWRDFAALAAFAVVILGLASLRLRRQWA